MTPQEIADKHRYNAYHTILKLFRIPAGQSNGLAESLVDDIVACAIAETTDLHRLAAQANVDYAKAWKHDHQDEKPQRNVTSITETSEGD